MMVSNIKRMKEKFSRSISQTTAYLFQILILTIWSSTTTASILHFESSGQSMWGEGSAVQLDESLFVGTTWDTPTAQIGGIIGDVIQFPGVEPILLTPAIPRQQITPYIPRKQITPRKRICTFLGCITIPATYTPAIPAVYTPAIPAVYTPAIPASEIDTRTGAKVEVSTDGKVGLEFSVEMDSGSVNTEIEFDASLSAPEEINALTLFELDGQADLLNSSMFDTTFPTLSAKAEFILRANADFDGQACLVGAGCAQGSTSIGFDEFALELISFNEDNNGKIRLLGLDELGPAAFNFGDPISVEAAGTEVGNVTVFVPDLETSSSISGDQLVSGGSTDILDLKLDIDGILTASAGLPPYWAQVSKQGS